MGKQLKKHVLHNYAIRKEERSNHHSASTRARNGNEDIGKFISNGKDQYFEPTEITFTVETSDEDEFPMF